MNSAIHSTKILFSGGPPFHYTGFTYPLFSSLVKKKHMGKKKLKYKKHIQKYPLAITHPYFKVVKPTNHFTDNKRTKQKKYPNLPEEWGNDRYD